MTISNLDKYGCGRAVGSVDVVTTDFNPLIEAAKTTKRAVGPIHIQEQAEKYNPCLWHS